MRVRSALRRRKYPISYHGRSVCYFWGRTRGQGNFNNVVRSDSRPVTNHLSGGAHSNISTCSKGGEVTCTSKFGINEFWPHGELFFLPNPTIQASIPVEFDKPT
jgi:hypothetical protein